MNCCVFSVSVPMRMTFILNAVKQMREKGEKQDKSVHLLLGIGVATALPLYSDPDQS